MKKLFIAASLLAVSFGSFAQDTKAPTESTTEGFVSKNGHQVLPVAGDWAVSFNATPVLEYVGNAFSGNNNKNTIATDYANSGVPAIRVKYFTDANTAYRVGFNIGLNSNSTKTNVSKVGGTATEYVENKVTTKNTNVVLAVGLEKRKGSSRVQGFYGAELALRIIGNANTKNEFGNALSASNTNGGATRTLETKVGNSFSVGPRGFIGAEYFIAPKLSLGGEFGYAVLFSRTGDSETTTEQWDFGTSTVKTQTTPSTTSGGAGTNGINLGVDNLSGSINLNFYF